MVEMKLPGPGYCTACAWAGRESFGVHLQWGKVGRNRLVSVVVFESADFYTIFSFWVNDDRTEERVPKCDNSPSFEWSWKIFSNPYSRHKEGMLVFHWHKSFHLPALFEIVQNLWHLAHNFSAAASQNICGQFQVTPPWTSTGKSRRWSNINAKCRSSSISSISISQK